MKKTLTPRERVLKSLNHQEPDRVPIDFGGNQTGITKSAYKKLISHLGITDDIRTMDLVQELAEPGEEVLLRFGVDTRYVRPGGPKSWKLEIKKRRDEQGVEFLDFTDEWGVIRTRIAAESNYNYWDIIHCPLEHMTLAELKNHAWPRGDDPGRVEGLREHARRLRENTGYAVVSGISGVVFEMVWYMRGFQRFYMDLIENPKVVEYLLDVTLNYWLDFQKIFLEETGEYLDVVCIGDDLGAQNASLISPELYRKYVKPRHRKLIEFIKERTGAKIWYHSCGSIYPLIPDLIEIGVDILNPVQYTGRDMNAGRLKKEFGDKIVFWGGGIDTQKILPLGSVEDVENEVRARVADLKPGGGFVFNTVHNIQGDVPPGNVAACFDAALKFGEYR